MIWVYKNHWIYLPSPNNAKSKSEMGFLISFFFAFISFFYASVIYKLILSIWKHKPEFAFSFFFAKKTDLWMCEVFHVWCLPVLLWGGGQTGRCPDVSSHFFLKGEQKFFATILQAIAVTLPWLTFSNAVFFKVSLHWRLKCRNTWTKYTCRIFIHVEV